jgi:hypothetical protein
VSRISTHSTNRKYVTSWRRFVISTNPTGVFWVWPSFQISSKLNFSTDMAYDITIWYLSMWASIWAGQSFWVGFQTFVKSHLYGETLSLFQMRSRLLIFFPVPWGDDKKDYYGSRTQLLFSSSQGRLVSSPLLLRH